MLGLNKVYNMDCIEWMRLIDDNSIDSIVTDPPYELWFMGKSWDNTGISNNKEMWAECLRILKPWGYLLSFGGTRTYHRMACAIEDAGFEVRDMIEWVYSTGFPKSLNIAKSIESKLKTGSCAKNNFHQLEGERRDGRIGMYDTVEEHGFRKVNPDQLGAFDLEATTQEAKQWEGWGTALKPAHEPICMARKPIQGTVAENCLKWGTGGINIDESRVGLNGEKTPTGSGKIDSWREKEDRSDRQERVQTFTSEQGRFPANLIHDNSEEVRECFPNESERFFKSIIYQAKASKSERNKGLDLHKLISIMGLDLSSNNPLWSTEQPDQNQLHLLDIDLSPQKEGSECEIKIKKGKDLSMSLYEKLLTDQYLNDYKSTIKTTTNWTTTLTTLNWLRHCITKEYIADVNWEIEFGESLVEIVEWWKKSTTTIKGKLGYLLGVKNVVAEMQLIIKEKENKNHHSTVKPIALMEYLIKMVTPKGGIVLDPFMWSWTTGCASKKNWYNYIWFELDKWYREIANKRIQSIQSQLF